MKCQFCRTEIKLTRVEPMADEREMARLRVDYSCECSAWSGALLRVNVHDPSKVVAKTIELPAPSVSKHVRSNLATEVQKYWVGKPDSNIGLQYLRLHNGVIEVPEFSFERKDLLLVQFWGVCNVFVEPSGHIQIDAWSETILSEADRAHIAAQIPPIVAAHEEFFKEENRFFQEKPWLQVHGMTPEQALAKFVELGWGPKEVK